MHKHKTIGLVLKFLGIVIYIFGALALLSFLSYGGFYGFLGSLILWIVGIVAVIYWVKELVSNKIEKGSLSPVNSERFSISRVIMIVVIIVGLYLTYVTIINIGGIRG